MDCNAGSGLSSYRLTLFEIGEELTGDDVDRLCTLCVDRVTARDRETVKNAHHLFLLLEKKDLIGEGNLAMLKDLLEMIGQRVLAKKLDATTMRGADISRPDGDVSEGEPRLHSAGPAGNPRPVRGPQPAETRPGVRGQDGAADHLPISLRSEQRGAGLDLAGRSEQTIETDAPQAKELDPGPAVKAIPQRPTGVTPELQACHLDQNDADVASAEDDRMEVDEESETIHLREYQKELASTPVADGGNYIICIPTGSGKTVTAAHICRARYDQFQAAASSPGRHFKALFVVPTRHLRQQQQRAFSVFFPAGGSVMTVADQQTFEQALSPSEADPAVLMLTAQIFVNALKAGKASFRDLQMLILDECHHADLEHPYNAIMKRYLRAREESSEGAVDDGGQRRLPQVIGLSASLGVGQGKTALGHVLRICANMDARNVLRVRRHRAELERYVKTPEQDSIVPVAGRPATGRTFGTVLDAIMAQIQAGLDIVDRIKLPRRGCQPYENELKRRKELSIKPGDVISYMYLAAYNRALMLFEDLPVEHCLYTLKQFHQDRGFCPDPVDQPISMEEQCQQHFRRHLPELEQMAAQDGDGGNPKLRALVEHLVKQFTQIPASKGIILTQTRIGTVGLCEFIRASKDLKALVRPERLVGQGPLEDFCISESAQRDVLDSFRQEDGCNVLVATDIAQEGLDMPACNFVFRYNFVSNEIGTVQSKGRARAVGSKCYLIVEDGSKNHQRELGNREKVERMEEALKQLEALEEGQRLEEIKAEQRKVMAGVSEATRRRQQQVLNRRAEVEVLVCAECKSDLCRLEDLSRKGLGNKVTCTDRDFWQKVREEGLNEPARCFRDTQTVCKIICNAVLGCRNKLGTKEDFFLEEETVGCSLTAKRFMCKLRNGQTKNLKKWIDLIPEE